jgi:Na+/H+ antiporter NhaC
MIKNFFHEKWVIRIFILVSFIALMHIRYGWTTGTDYLYGMYIELFISISEHKLID